MCHVIKYNNPISYKEGLEIQKIAFDIVNNGETDGVLLLLEHNPVFTIGKSGGKENLLISKEKLDEYGIELCETNRGGNITYHGHGQLVGYPIFNLRKFKKDVIWYVRQLEEVIIKTLKNYDIIANRKPQYPGVWVDDKKIAALGIHAKKWITMHGFSFNIDINKQHFGLINPCGITEFGITSLNNYIEKVEFNDVVNLVESAFKEVFEIQFKNIDSNKLIEFNKILCK